MAIVNLSEVFTVSASLSNISIPFFILPKEGEAEGNGKEEGLFYIEFPFYLNYTSTISNFRDANP